MSSLIKVSEISPLRGLTGINLDVPHLLSFSGLYFHHTLSLYTKPSVSALLRNTSATSGALLYLEKKEIKIPDQSGPVFGGYIKDNFFNLGNNKTTIFFFSIHYNITSLKPIYYRSALWWLLVPCKTNMIKLEW